MEGERFAEARHVVVSAAARVVGGVDSDAEVGAHYKHADVEAQPDAGAERYVFPESFGAERAAGARGVVLEQPYGCLRQGKRLRGAARRSGSAVRC